MALFQGDIDRFHAAIKEIVKGGVLLDEALSIGELRQLDDAQWEKIVKEFFRP